MDSDTPPDIDSGSEASVETPQAADEVKAAVDRYVRLAAEFENYKKRAQKDQAEYIKYANEKLLKDLLPVLDNLQRALQHAQTSNGADGLVQGIELTYKQYLDILSRFGVKPIPSVGLQFDPAVHQAVAVVEAKKGQEPNTVADEHEKGYYLHDRVLRPAVVTVVGSSESQANKKTKHSSIEEEETEG
jgi:molecular chaperone GrpE